MTAKKDQYRIFIPSLVPRWAVRVIPGGFPTLQAAQDGKARLLSRAGGMGYMATFQIVEPPSVRTKMLRASATNLFRCMLETRRSPVAEDFDDALPRLEKLARYHYVQRQKFENLLDASWAGELRTVRKGALSTEAGLRFMFDFKKLDAEYNRIDDYQYTREESEALQSDYSGEKRSEWLKEMRDQLDGMVLSFVTSTIHSDEL
jgi:hypothetical protein